MILQKYLKITILLTLLGFTLSSCKGGLKGADARKYPPNPEERVKKNIEEGRGFRLSDSFGWEELENLSLLARIHYGEQP